MKINLDHLRKAYHQACEAFDDAWSWAVAFNGRRDHEGVDTYLEMRKAYQNKIDAHERLLMAQRLGMAA